MAKYRKKPVAERGPEATVVAQAEIALPGWPAMSGAIALPEGATATLDEVCIQLHELVNDLRTNIRKKGPTI